jgi:hypothetical protein
MTGSCSCASAMAHWTMSAPGDWSGGNRERADLGVTFSTGSTTVKQAKAP